MAEKVFYEPNGRITLDLETGEVFMEELVINQFGEEEYIPVEEIQRLKAVKPQEEPPF